MTRDPVRAHCERGGDAARARGTLHGPPAGCGVAASRRNSSIVSTRQISPSPKQKGHSRLGHRCPASAGRTPSPPHSAQRSPRNTLPAGSGEASSGERDGDDRAAADMLGASLSQWTASTIPGGSDSSPREYESERNTGKPGTRSRVNAVITPDAVLTSLGHTMLPWARVGWRQYSIRR